LYVQNVFSSKTQEAVVKLFQQHVVTIVPKPALRTLVRSPWNERLSGCWMIKNRLIHKPHIYDDLVGK
jgi:hypothetical protein